MNFPTRAEQLADAKRALRSITVERERDTRMPCANPEYHRYARIERFQRLAAVRTMRLEAMNRERVDPAGRAFYVSIRRSRSDQSYGLLYGPLPTHAAALKALPMVEAVSNDVNAADAAFAAFGTASVPLALARPGILNRYLPEVPV